MIGTFCLDLILTNGSTTPLKALMRKKTMKTSTTCFLRTIGLLFIVFCCNVVELFQSLLLYFDDYDVNIKMFGLVFYILDLKNPIKRKSLKLMKRNWKRFGSLTPACLYLSLVIIFFVIIIYVAFV